MPYNVRQTDIILREVPTSCAVGTQLAENHRPNFYHRRHRHHHYYYYNNMLRRSVYNV